MSRRDEVKYKRLRNSNDDFETQQPLLASANGRTSGERIPLAERRSAFYGPTGDGGSSERPEPTQLRARGESAALSRSSPKLDEQSACLEREIYPGETLTSISVQYSCPVALLKQVNHLVADQEFYGLKVLRVPTKKYGLLSELLALENEENRQQLAVKAAGRASQLQDVPTASGISGVTGRVGIPERIHAVPVVLGLTTEPGSPSTYSDPSDYECDESHAVGRSVESQHRADRGHGSGNSLSGPGTTPLSDFLKAKDEELKSIAASIDCRLASTGSNDTMMLMRTSPTFPLQIQRTRRSSGGFSIGVRWAIASVVVFVLIILLGITAVIFLKHFHAS